MIKVGSAHGFIIDDIEKISFSYSLSDGYPSHLSRLILDFCGRNSPAEISMFARAITAIPAEENANPTDPRMKVSYLNSCAQKFPYPRDTLAILANSLICQYAYIINCDTGFLEFYIGMNRDKNAKGRYAKFYASDQTYPDTPGGKKRKPQFYGVRLAHEYPLVGIKEAHAACTMEELSALGAT